jgi:hypothetical protein
VPAATVETHAATHEPGTSPVAGDNALCHDALPAAAASKEADLATTEQTVQPPEQQGETTAIKMESLEGLPADMHSHEAEVIDSSQEQEPCLHLCLRLQVNQLQLSQQSQVGLGHVVMSHPMRICL